MIKTLAAALEQRGYTDLTPVQKEVAKPEFDEADLLVSAQTGSGKTVGFGLAIAPTLLGDAEHFGPAAAPLALIIAPTRELALQVKRELEWLYEKTGAVVASCVGGMDMRTERQALERGRAYRCRHARAAVRSHQARLTRHQPAAGRRAGRSRRDARSRLSRGPGIHSGRGPRAAPHADVFRHRAARHRGRWPRTISATQCVSPPPASRPSMPTSNTAR